MRKEPNGRKPKGNLDLKRAQYGAVGRLVEEYTSDHGQ